MSKTLLEQAIAEAKAVRQTALENAKLALEEAIAPKLQHMFSTKLSEELDEEEDLNEEFAFLGETEEELEEAKDDDKKDSKPKSDSSKKDDKPKSEPKDDAGSDNEAADFGGEEVEDVDSKDVKDLSVEELKNVIRDIVQTELAGDVTPGDETMGDDMAPGIEDEMGGDLGSVGDDLGGAEDLGTNGDEFGTGVAGEEEDDDFNLDEILAELEAINTSGDNIKEAATVKKNSIKHTTNKKTGAPGFKKVGELKEVEEELEESEVKTEELNEAYKAIRVLRKELNEVNLLNAKLIYVNSIFKDRNLNESQKLKVIEKFDKATNIKEAKLVFETLLEALRTKPSPKKLVKESMGFASKAAGVASKKPIVQVDETVRRFQELAGIIKK